MADALRCGNVLENNAEFVRPDYRGGGIANLISSVAAAFGDTATLYPPTPLVDPARLERVRNIVLLVVDGLGYHYLREKCQGSFLQRSLAGSLTSVCPSTTASAIPTFLTGVPPQQHGFTGWFTYFHEVQDILSVLPFNTRAVAGRDRPVKATPLELSGAKPLFSRLDANCSVLAPHWIAASRFNVAFNAGARILPYRDMTDFFRGLSDCLDQEGRSYTYAYWPDFDSLAHQFGVESVEAGDHIQQFDQALERWVGQVAGSDTLLLVTADHGFIDSPPERTIHIEQHPQFQDCLALPLCGEPRLAFCYLRKGKKIQFEEYLKGELSHCLEVVPSLDMVDDGWFGIGQPYSALRQRVGDFTLLMKENYKIKDTLPGEHPYAHIGVHGGASDVEMYVPLAVAEI